MGFWGTIAKKLPTWRGFINYFYVAANWGRISEEQEAYRRQIKDREEWARQALAQQAQLHELAQQRAAEQMRQWQELAARAGGQVERAMDALEKMKAEIERRGEVGLWLGNRFVNCMVVLAQVLAEEEPATRALLMRSLDEGTRSSVAGLIARIEEIERSRPGDSDALAPSS